MAPPCVWNVTRASVANWPLEPTTKNNTSWIETRRNTFVPFAKMLLKWSDTLLTTWKEFTEFHKKCSRILMSQFWIQIKIDLLSKKSRFLNCVPIHKYKSSFFLDFLYEEQEPKELGLCDFEDGTSMCLKCHKKFNSTHAARTHFKEIHQVDRSQKNIVCPICNKGFSIQRYKVDHMKKVHGISSKMYKNTYIP